MQNMFTANIKDTKTAYRSVRRPATLFKKRLQWRRSGVFIVNAEQISHIAMVFQ